MNIQDDETSKTDTGIKLMEDGTSELVADETGEIRDPSVAPYGGRNPQIIMLRAVCAFLLLWTILLGVMYGMEKNKKNDNAATASSGSAAALLDSTSFLTILQINDVYELKPVGNDQGGLARVAGLKKDLLKARKSNNVVCILAGDVISPSALATATFEGSALNGRQMINVTNSFVDYMVYGNHEFDYSEAVFKQRTLESQFTWLTTNMNTASFAETDKKGITKKYDVRTFKTPTGSEVKVAFIGIAPDYAAPSWVSVSNISETIRTLPTTLSAIRSQHKPDLIIAVTHLNIDEDIKVVTSGLGIDMIIGGHEHQNSLHRAPDLFVPVAKADANAVSAYVHDFILVKKGVDPKSYPNQYNTPTFVGQNKSVATVAIQSRLRRIEASTPQDSAVSKQIEYWWEVAKSAFSASGFNIDEKIGVLKDHWDLRLEALRLGHPPFANFYGDMMLDCLKGYPSNRPDMALFMSGLLRLDDFFGPGEVTVYDTLRVSPYANDLIVVNMSGAVLLDAIATSSTKNKYMGGYLHWSKNVRCDTATGTGCVFSSPNGKALDRGQHYLVATIRWLMEGKEINLPMLKFDATNVVDLSVDGTHPKKDLQRCFIDYLRAYVKK
eukprot:PhM_4_TR17185/c0_g1_i1/m.53165